MSHHNSFDELAIRLQSSEGVHLLVVTVEKSHDPKQQCLGLPPHPRNQSWNQSWEVHPGVIMVA